GRVEPAPSTSPGKTTTERGLAKRAPLRSDRSHRPKPPCLFARRTSPAQPIRHQDLPGARRRPSRIGPASPVVSPNENRPGAASRRRRGKGGPPHQGSGTGGNPRGLPKSERNHHQDGRGPQRRRRAVKRDEEHHG